MLSYSAALMAGQSPYFGLNLYAPLTNVFFVPLVFMNFAAAYALMSVLSLLCVAWTTYALPMLISGTRQLSALHALILAGGFLSYGLQFEIERGQFNVLAVTLCLVAVWIYHYHVRYRFLAYVLFLTSVQLKLYPFIFALLL